MFEPDDNPWVRLIARSNEEKDMPTRRWNGFQRFLAETAKKDVSDSLPELVEKELSKAKSFFPAGFDFQSVYEINFKNAEFSSSANFWDAQFSGDAHFGFARFSGNAEFTDAQFSEDANFESAEFSERAIFTSLKNDEIKIRFDFKSAVFR